MAMTNTLIVDAMTANMTARGITPSSDQITDMTNVANAIIATIETATLTYTVGLISGTPGAPVTGVMTAVVIS